MLTDRQTTYTLNRWIEKQEILLRSSLFKVCYHLERIFKIGLLKGWKFLRNLVIYQNRTRRRSGIKKPAKCKSDSKDSVAHYNKKTCVCMGNLFSF